jgi:hypothetical protein
MLPFAMLCYGGIREIGEFLEAIFRNPVEGRTKICQLTDMIQTVITHFGQSDSS